MNWEDSRVLMSVMESGGYAGAAESLGICHGTVRRHVERLAHKLGSALFIHSPEGLTPTPSAAALTPVLERVAGAASAFARLASADIDSLQGEVRLVAPPYLAVDFLAAYYAGQGAGAPGLIVEFETSRGIGWSEVESGLADVGVATTAPASSAIDARRAARLGTGFYASEEFIASHGAPTCGEDLARFALVADQGGGSLKLVCERLHLPHDTLRAVFRSDVPAARIAAIRSGVGIGLCPVFAAQEDPELVRVLPQFTALFDVWVGVREDMADVRRIVFIRDALVQHIQGLEAETSCGGRRADR
ncbi:MAG: LysR family transcriptional regulator [Caulobacteraceae bacterium]|nr:LysR family transcriptional regulator [Caulobacteraceae bacterium]